MNDDDHHDDDDKNNDERISSGSHKHLICQRTTQIILEISIL